MGQKDPEGTETRSEKERRDNLDKTTRDLLGLPAPKDPNPEGVPEKDK